MLRRFFYLLVILFIFCFLSGCFVLVWGYFYFSRDLPRFDTIKDYAPPAVSKIYSSDGTLIAEFFTERRYPVQFNDIPPHVRNAFLAAEDASFYKHPGIDPVSILRALVANLKTGSVKQGGSTITQQVVKNILLTKERSIERKIKEAILAYRIEQRLNKDQIFLLYLNQIFFGNTAYGIQSAAKMYFHKNVKDLTLAEASMLAGLPKAPSKYSPIKNYKAAKKRQRYVLSQMADSRFISKNEGDSAYLEELNIYTAERQGGSESPYYASEVKRIFAEKWKGYNIDTDGLEIYTSIDLDADRFAQRALRRGLKEVDKRRGWRGRIGSIEGGSTTSYLEEYRGYFEKEIKPETIYPALVTSIRNSPLQIKLVLGTKEASLNIKDASWAKKFLFNDEASEWIELTDNLHVGDIIEVSIPAEQFEHYKKTGVVPSVILDQTPKIEGAIVLIDPNSGRVRALVGGYDYNRSQFNRATQSYRQPGSAFKPIVYLTAIDSHGYTPATIVHDEPRTFKVGDDYWEPENFDEGYLGPITLRTALEKSRNLISADIVSRVGVDPIIQYARKLGIESKLGRNLSLSLGSSEVTLLELTRVYGVFASGGLLFDSVLIDRIEDRYGETIFDYEVEKLGRAKQVISESTAFIMANLMKGVVTHGTGYRVKQINRPVAGKTGTSNDQMDTWFIGYTPEWVCGVWAGFDLKIKIGPKETGGVVAAPIWLYFMNDYLNFLNDKNYTALISQAKEESERLGIEFVTPNKFEPLDFKPPDGVQPFLINRQTGVATDESDPGALLEYFIRGTKPNESATGEDSINYWNSEDL